MSAQQTSNKKAQLTPKETRDYDCMKTHCEPFLDYRSQQLTLDRMERPRAQPPPTQDTLNGKSKNLNKRKLRLKL